MKTVKSNRMLLFFIFMLPVVSKAQLSEYETKAIFLERFTRFVEWPEENGIQDTAQTFVLGVVEENPFDHYLEEIYKNQLIKRKRVQIRYIKRLDEIKGCQLLFISEFPRFKLNDIINYTQNKEILTIGDTPGYAQKGVHINMYKKESRLLFEINETAVFNSGLYMSHLLLKTARIVNPRKR